MFFFPRLLLWSIFIDLSAVRVLFVSHQSTVLLCALICLHLICWVVKARSNSQDIPQSGYLLTSSPFTEISSLLLSPQEVSEIPESENLLVYNQSRLK